MKTYRILTGTPIDSNSATPYWIEITEKYFFNLFTRRRVIGDYIIDNTYRELGDCPFLSYEAAEERIKQLKNR